jgi:site-specific DNA recombinase
MRGTTPTTTLTAADYLRVSQDASGRERSNEEQHGENASATADAGIKLLDAGYSDIGSASIFQRRARGGWAELIADLEAGRFPADVLVLWEASRGSRKIEEWVHLLNECKRHGKLIFVTTHDELYDPAKPRDRKTLLTEAVDAEYESAKTSLRVNRHVARDAEAGRPGAGSAPFGYRRIYDSATGELAAQVPEPEEARIVAELYERIVRGDSLRAIAIDFERRGYRGRRGGVLSGPTLRQMALSPTYSGRRIHCPTDPITGKRDRRGGTLTDAIWPELVPRDVWLAVHRRLTDPARVTKRPGSGKHLLSMLTRCKVCKGVLTAAYPKRRDGSGERQRTYWCVKGHVRVDADDLDDVATERIMAFLTAPHSARRLRMEEDHSEALTLIRAEIEEIKGDLADLAAEATAGRIKPTLAGQLESGLEARLADAREREEALTVPDQLRGLLGPLADIEPRWGAATMPAKREIVRFVLSAEMAGELRVGRAPQRNAPTAERVWWVTA